MGHDLPKCESRLLSPDIQLFRTASDVPHQLSIESSSKLKRTNRWMTELRRKIELFNRCVEQCEDANSMRMEMSEIFDPLLAILHQSIRYLQRHNTGKLGRIPPRGEILRVVSLSCNPL